jgi:SpoVK/Ycf46/Vps4 family AAA+-type ATPase
MDALRNLELLITSRYPIIVIETYEEERVEQVLQRVAERLGLPLFVWTVSRGLRRAGAPEGIYNTRDPLKALGNVAAMASEGIYLFEDLHRSLGDPAIVRKLQDLARALAHDRRAIVLAAPRVELPPELATLAAVFRLDLPSQEELKALAVEVVRSLSARHRIAVGLSPEELDQLAAALKGLTLFEAERALTRASLNDFALNREDLNEILAVKKELLAKERVLEYVPAGDGLGDVGGLGHLKAWLEKRSRAFTAEARQFGVPPPKGILLLGVQGCGKTLAARAVAKAWGLPLLKLEAGRLYNKFVGESEKGLDRALETAERMAPCVLMLDEIEKALGSGISSDADAGLSGRIFGRLLGWLQDHTAPVCVVATCNRIASLPPELTRKGRFDEIFFVDLPTPEERREIFAVHLRRRQRDPAAFDLDALAAASEGFSGAEIEQVVVSALYTAFSRDATLSTQHILDELAATRPLSVTRAEEVAELREWARGRAVPAS